MASADVGQTRQREEWQQEWADVNRRAEESLPEALLTADNLLERMLIAAGYPVDVEEARASSGVYVPGDDSTDVLEDFFQARAMVRVLDSPWPPTGKALKTTFDAYEVLYDWLMDR